MCGRLSHSRIWFQLAKFWLSPPEFYLFVDQTANVPPPLGNAPGLMNVVLRTTLPPATLRQTLERVVREADPSVPIVRLREMDAVFEEAMLRRAKRMQIGFCLVRRAQDRFPATLRLERSPRR